MYVLLWCPFSPCHRVILYHIVCSDWRNQLTGFIMSRNVVGRWLTCALYHSDVKYLPIYSPDRERGQLMCVLGQASRLFYANYMRQLVFTDWKVSPELPALKLLHSCIKSHVRWLCVMRVIIYVDKILLHILPTSLSMQPGFCLGSHPHNKWKVYIFA